MSQKAIAKLRQLRTSSKKQELNKASTARVKSEKRNGEKKKDEDFDENFFSYMNDDSSDDEMLSSEYKFDPSIYGQVLGKKNDKESSVFELADENDSEEELSRHLVFSTNSDSDDEEELQVKDLKKNKKKQKKEKQPKQQVHTEEEMHNVEEADEMEDIPQSSSENSTTKKSKDENEWTETELVEMDNNQSSSWKKVNLSDEDAFACEGLYSLEVLDTDDDSYKEIMRQLYGDNYDNSTTTSAHKKENNEEDDGEDHETTDTRTEETSNSRTPEEIRKERNRKKRERKKKAQEKKQAAAASSNKDDSTTDEKQENTEEGTEQSEEDAEESEETPKQSAPQESKTEPEKKKKEKAAELKVVNQDADSISLDELNEKMKAWNFDSQVTLHEQIIRNLYRLGFYTPTPIQEASIPKALAEKADVLAAAETGSGKTLAFALPIIEELLRLKEQGEDSLSKFEDTSATTGVDLNEIGVNKKRKKMLRDVKKDMFRLKSLILLPTRELAVQVSTHIQAVIRNTPIKVVSLLGGLNEEKQIREIHVLKPDIIVATPGRYWYYIDKGMFASNSILGLRFLVIDEADRMVADAHFFELQSILRYITVERFKRSQQANISPEDVPSLRKFISSATLTFIDDKWKQKLQDMSQEEQTKLQTNSNNYTSTSADVDEDEGEEEEPQPEESSSADKNLDKQKKKKKKESKIQKIIQKILAILDMQNPLIVDLTTSNLLAHTLQEAHIESTREDKVLYLYYFITLYSGRTVVFTNNIKAVRFIGNVLKELFIKGPNSGETKTSIVSLHGKMDQQARFKNLEKFKRQENCILITTDVFARGIDIPDVENVVHFNIPADTKTYIHRCGRSGRAGKQGFSLAIVAPEERKQYFHILRDTQREETGLPTFPISNPDLLEVLRKRIRLAIEIVKLEEKKAAKTQEQDWFTKQAKALDIELDDTFFRDLKRDRDSKMKGLSKQQEQNLSRMKNDLSTLLKQNVFMQTKTSQSGSSRLFTVGDPEVLI
ncbi:hypothetical protein C9374_013241 [Naegleria lovaniensis]|uniref:Probable eukaryotic initiation factor 4A n=1 Tax=Naegleria lovaniensis TaxID=51637 RepID=A0AA88H072_NAELO|nr:uncharacterized protein C9374_013241 [Naegleria lovaniensis]KAG2391756.1 hypothetical protein C9374_013241 [Naegleria lovaniensis]